MFKLRETIVNGIPHSHFDLKGALSLGLFNVVLVFFLVQLSGATGTLMGVAGRAALLFVACLMLLTSQARRVKPVVWVIAVVFLIKYAYVGG